MSTNAALKPEVVLLTGVTGLVGSSVIVALVKSKANLRFVCLVRSSGGISAKDRAHYALREECEFEGCPELYEEVVRRVSIIDGDMTTIDEGIFEGNDLLKDVRKVFHCAADVNLGKDPTGRVYRVNYEGTRNIVNLAKALCVKELHYVATAYVAGRQTGVVFEEAQCPACFNNPYEESKCKAENLVRESGIPYTIYRPAIIVGRKIDGRIRKPLAFYRILEFLQKLKERTARVKGLDVENWVDMDMNCAAIASAHIYFVPIDYVQAAIATLFQKPAVGLTYHVTGDSPVSADQILKSVCSVFKLDGVSISNQRECRTAEERMFTKYVGDLFPYFSSDIMFDQTNIRRDFPQCLKLEYGDVDLSLMVRAYLTDQFSDVGWVKRMLAVENDREPKIPRISKERPGANV